MSNNIKKYNSQNPYPKFDRIKYRSFLKENFSGQNFKKFPKYLEQLKVARSLEFESIQGNAALLPLNKTIEKKENYSDNRFASKLEVLSDSEEEDFDDSILPTLSENVPIPEDFSEKLETKRGLPKTKIPYELHNPKNFLTLDDSGAFLLVCNLCKKASKIYHTNTSFWTDLKEKKYNYKVKNRLSSLKNHYRECSSNHGLTYQIPTCNDRLLSDYKIILLEGGKRSRSEEASNFKRKLVDKYSKFYNLTLIANSRWKSEE